MEYDVDSSLLGRYGRYRGSHYCFSGGSASQIVAGGATQATMAVAVAIAGRRDADVAGTY